MLRALLYFVTPKNVVAKAYIKTLLNKQGFYWKKMPSQLLGELADCAVRYAKAISSMSKNLHFSNELATICEVYTSQLCDRLEANNSDKDVSEDIKFIFNKYNFSLIDAKNK